MPSASAAPQPARLRRLIPWGIALLGALYLGFIATHCSPYAGGADSSGYLNGARLLLEGRCALPIPEIAGLDAGNWDPLLQQPLGFVYRPERQLMMPTYPVGLSLHLAVASWLVSLDQAMIPVGLLCAAAAAFFTVALGRRLGLSQPWALAGGALLLMSPLFLLMVNQPMSDVPALVWVSAACYFGVRARERWVWALAAGGAVAMAVLVRPTNLLVMLPLAVALGLRWRAWLALAVAGAPGAVFLAWYNVQLYDKALTTGYGDIGGLLKAGYVPHNTAHFVLWLAVLLSPPVALAAYGLPWLRRHSPFAVSLLAVWVAAFAGFYIWYFYSGETWWYLRFILPAFPPAIIAGLLVLEQCVAPRVPARIGRLAWPLGLLACLLWLGLWGWHFNVDRVRRGEANYPEAMAWLNAHVPENAIVLEWLLSGASTYYSPHTLVRWDVASRAQMDQLYAAAEKSGRPVYAALMEFEIKQAFPDGIPGRWEKVGEVRRVTFWRLVEAGGVQPAP